MLDKELLTTAGTLLAVVAAGVAASFLLSFVAKPLILVLNGTRRAAAVPRRRWMAVGEEVWGTFRSHWITRQREFTHPVIVELSRLRSMVDALGRPAFDRLRASIQDLDRRMQRVTRNAADDPAGSQSLELRASEGAVSWFVFAVSLFVLLAMSAANFWMLRLFFGQVASDALAWFGLARYLTGADILAALFPLVEFGSGVILHVLQDPGDREVSPTQRFLGSVAPWVVIFALGLVEMVAYAQLSIGFGLDQAFALEPSHPMYPIARYFMAPFGVALTLGIAGLGYYIIEAWQRSREPRLLARNRRYLVEASTALDRLMEAGPGAVSGTIEAVKEAESVLEHKMRVLGVEPEEGLGTRVDGYARELLRVSRVAPSGEPQVPNAAGQLGLALLLLGAFALALWLNARNYQSVAPTFAPELVRMLIGFTIAGVVTAVGYALGQRDYGRRRDSPQSVLEGHALPTWLLYPVALAAVGLSLLLAMQHEVVSDRWWWSNAIYGFLLPSGLMVLAHRLPTMLQAAALVLYALLAAARVIVQLVAAMVMVLIEAAATAVAWLVRIASVPGFVLRRKAIP